MMLRPLYQSVFVARNFQDGNLSLLLFRVSLYVRSLTLESTWIFLAPASGKKYILVITDSFSKYTELSAIPDKSANSVARSFFECWICRHGVPRLIVSDRGKEFLNIVMKDLCDYMGIDHRATSSYHPQSMLCLLYTSPSPRDRQKSRMPSSA